MKLFIAKFDGSELYKGLDANFSEWDTNLCTRLP